MKSGWGAWGRIALVVCCQAMAVTAQYAQNPSAASSAQAARAVLAEKARVLEARGRPDMALQLWQQILLSDPKNAEALAGEAREYKVLGNADKAAESLNRLRAVNPADPNIARLESMSNQTQSEQLKQAGALAKQNKPEDAMRIFRQLYGDNPPNGDIARLYYQTLYATKDGKAAAVAGMRNLVAKNPGSSQYPVALGTMLTYDARTRAEGMRILQSHPQNPDAQSAFRQALIWNAANPATAGQLREFLKTHPQDQEIAGLLKQAETKLAQSNTGIAGTPAEQAAFAALNANRLDEADARFTALLAKNPNNSRLLAGMGYLRMRQQNFSAAISFLSQAQANGSRDKSVQDALVESRFWLVMGEATQAFNNHQYDLAQNKFHEALMTYPQSPEALSGLAGLFIRQQQYTQAADTYERLLRVRPDDSDGWRGLFLAYARSGQNEKALGAIARIPAPVKTSLAKDLDYLRTLASVYQAQGNTAEAQRVLLEALALPVTESNTALQLDTRLQYAGMLLQLKRYSEAATQYTQVLNQNPSNLGAWEGLVTAHHNLGQDTQAIEDVKRMPAAVYESAIADPAFLAQLGAIYQQSNQFDVAQSLLERAERQSAATGNRAGVDLQLQLAAIYLLRNDPTRAYGICRQLLAANAANPKVWQGLITALHAANRDAEAVQQIALIPAGVRKQLESSIDFIQIEAGVYAGAGDVAHALQYVNTAKTYYAKLNQIAPPDVEVQNAWLLYNVGDDRSLYDVLMRLGARMDLSVAQREMVQNIWASWSVRRASAAMDNSDYRRAIDILDAARLAFPNNITVSKALAGGYLQVGRAKEALAIFKTIPMQNASSADFQGAVGAALGANDKAQAEIWLRQALDRYPRDPAILTLAARYEQARGNNERAAEYYRASIALMPKVSPVDRLAHVLVNPDTDTRPHKAVTAADLERLLNPENEPFPKTVKLPPLPAYGPDPYDSTPALTNPASQQFEPTQDSKPLIVPIPNGALTAPATFETPVPVSSGGTGAAQLTQFGAQPAAAELTANPPVSLAAQTWKGLISALVAGSRNAEALQELNRIPADIRKELEPDLEFAQCVATLYVTLGDMPRAQPWLTRLAGYFIQNRDNAPAGIAIQHAALLYTLDDAPALYNALLHLDARKDLTDAQQVETRKLWASLAVRRADDAMNRANLIYSVQILQAATQDFPQDMNVRRAMAAAYARVGRATDAVALYKALPTAGANAADFQSAISAALSAGDMAQAEAWLRQALTGYPRDAQILSLAARFEQARGNQQRSADFQRAAVSALPPGSNIAPMQSAAAYLPGSYRAPAPGATRYLLDPARAANSAAASELPQPGFQPQQPTADPSAAPRVAQRSTEPSGLPLPLPLTATLHGDAGGSEQGPASPIAPARASRAGDRSEIQPYTGRVLLPPSEENVDTIPEEVLAQRPTRETQASIADPSDDRFAGDQGTNIRSLPNARVQPLQDTSDPSQFTATQYTPSAQQATTGAYSAPKPASTQPVPQSTPQPTPPVPQPSAQPEPQPPTARPQPTARATNPRRRPATSTQRPPSPSIAQSQPIPTPQAPTPPPQPSAPSQTAAPQQSAAPPESSTTEQNPPASTGTGLTDQELEERNLPPLRGPWVRTQRQEPRPNPRDVAEKQLQQIESSYSGWIGGTSNVAYRSGTLGFSRLTALEDPFELSLPMGYHARFTLVANPVFLDSGQADGSATITVQQTTSSGTRLVAIPEPIGLLVNTDTAPPAQQNSMGIGGEAQLAFPNFAIAGGWMPNGFEVTTFTGRMVWKPANGPFTFTASRQPVKDSQLSYAGLRDPSGGTAGAVWGGVMSNQGGLQFSHGDAQSGFYLAGSAQYLSGRNVRTNLRIDGTADAYWRAFTAPEYGTLAIGANFFAMHYDNNQNAFTFGMGGYFSPQSYFLANVPVTWTGHYYTHWHYNIAGAIGAKAFQEDATPLWPLSGQRSLQALYGNPMLPDRTSISGNYDLRSHVAYQISPNWFAGGYLQGNNTRNYNYASAGFFVRYMFRQQPSTATAPTGLFPADGLRPFTVP